MVTLNFLDGSIVHHQRFVLFITCMLDRGFQFHLQYAFMCQSTLAQCSSSSSLSHGGGGRGGHIPVGCPILPSFTVDLQPLCLALIHCFHQVCTLHNSRSPCSCVPCGFQSIARHTTCSSPSSQVSVCPINLQYLLLMVVLMGS